MKLTPLNKPLELFGTGFPNRKVAAPVGSIYTDTDATAGAVRWIKTSGAETTGWAVEYGDTGWRAITLWSKDGTLAGELPNGMTAQAESGGIFYRRINGTVTLRVLAARAEAGYFSIPVPSGFAPAGAPYPVVPFSVASNSARAYTRVGASYAYVTVAGASADNPINLPSSGANYSSEATWGTDNRWPVALPGIPG